MAGYIGSKTSVTQVDGYNRTEADDEFVSKDGDTITTAAGTALTLDRTGSDGTILDLKKDGSTVGSIGTSSTFYLASNTVAGAGGIRFGNDTSTTLILPSTNTGTSKDGDVTLGYSSSRFKDLYLSGGVFLGGAGSANKLDDYEEGTWTPTAASGCTGFTIRRASYTKIGRLVYLQAYLSGITGKDGNPAKIGGMPFTPATNVYSGGFMDTASDGDVGFIRTNSSSATLSIYSWDSSSIHRNDMLGTEVGSQFIFSVLYETDA